MTSRPGFEVELEQAVTGAELGDGHVVDAEGGIMGEIDPDVPEAVPRLSEGRQCGPHTPVEVRGRDGCRRRVVGVVRIVLIGPAARLVVEVPRVDDLGCRRAHRRVGGPERGDPPLGVIRASGGTRVVEQRGCDLGLARVVPLLIGVLHREPAEGVQGQGSWPARRPGTAAAGRAPAARVAAMLGHPWPAPAPGTPPRPGASTACPARTCRSAGLLRPRTSARWSSSTSKLSHRWQLTCCPAT